MEGKVYIVTGSGSGIGRAVALELTKLKAKVVVSDINLKGCEETIALMKEINAEADAIAVECDISKEEDVAKLMTETIAKYGQLDGAVNNAGIIGKLMRIGDFQVSDFERMLNINVKGTFMCIRSQVQQMEKQFQNNIKGNYSIVNLSSIAGILSFPYNSPYSAVKHAILGLTKSTAAEYGVYNIRCNAVLPGASDTPMLREYLPTPDLLSQVTTNTPLRRASEPIEIAKSVIYLLSDNSSFVTGHSLVIDGGLSIV